MKFKRLTRLFITPNKFDLDRLYHFEKERIEDLKASGRDVESLQSAEVAMEAWSNLLSIYYGIDIKKDE